MAESKNNVLTYGLSGKVGDLLVFSQRSGKTIVSKAPLRPTAVSDKQREQRQRFQQATIYARGALADTAVKEQYEAAAKKKKSMNAYNVAVADFFNAPNIATVDLSSYTGAAGDEIRIVVTDDFAVEAVHVKIDNADGSPVEEGLAQNTSGHVWVYAATQNNDSLEGDRIVITAFDRPGNTDTENRSL